MNLAAPADPPVRLNPRLDPALIARVFRASGRVHVAGFLDAACAARIHRCLTAETPWRLVLFDGEEHRDLDVASVDGLPEAQRAELLERVGRAARSGFSYRYSNFRLFENYQEGVSRESYLMRVLEFLNSPPFRDLMRGITGDNAIDYADGQATLYRAGDFLTRHDDAVEGKNRRAAYVLGFTPEWSTDWGGLLAFPDRYGHVSEAFAPTFNSLNLFRVPALHAVTQVASFVTAGRYSITGWLRQQPA
jgi:Rps23 Pro-64 3,4-dihydroxylase Tpa1-like proline 4-hydroxylase